MRKARRWWQGRLSYLYSLTEPENRLLTISTRGSTGVARKRVHLKTMSGRGRKRAERVEYLHTKLFAEFERLRELSVKFSTDVIRIIALSILNQNDSIYGADTVEENLVNEWQI